ncbi:MAG: energy transducer TonB [Acidobacteria bacterium]|nr:energy transducer TonB [Acidobacteriota bacterium]
MFDKLVESSKEGQGRRKGRYIVVTTMIYTTAIVVSAIATIFSFDPVLGKELFLMGVAPPPPYEAQPAKSLKENDVNRAALPGKIPPIKIDEYPPAINEPSNKMVGSDRFVKGWGIDRFDNMEHGAPRDNSEPPPAPPKPKPTVTPPPANEVKSQETRKVSEPVLQGKAIRKIVPPYPEIAKKIKASGPVQILVTISEEGRVIEATALNGHPALRHGAVSAAEQWLFSPTYLGKVPVKVQGVLTFNFVLQ